MTDTTVPPSAGTHAQVIRTPLGLRFWDAVTDTQIREGLTVRARPAAGGRVTFAHRTLSGVYAFHGLPGMHDLEYPRGDSDASPSVARPFEVTVTDDSGRFLPTRFAVDLPHAGLYAVATSPPGAAAGFYLFSAPARTVPPGVAVLRAQLVDATEDAPAAHAVVEVTILGQRWFGIADERGVVAVLVPYPPFAGTLAASPPAGSTGVPLSAQAWEVAVAVRYDALRLAPDTGDVPLLGAVLGQAPGAMRPRAGDVPVPVLSEHLRFGDPLLLRTEGSPQGALEIARLP